MTTCCICSNVVDEAILMACTHHICLPCGCARLDTNGGITCPCSIHTQLTQEARQTLIATNCHSVRLCEPDTCGRHSPNISPRGHPYLYAAPSLPTAPRQLSASKHARPHPAGYTTPPRSAPREMSAPIPACRNPAGYTTLDTACAPHCWRDQAPPKVCDPRNACHRQHPHGQNGAPCQMRTQNCAPSYYRAAPNCEHAAHPAQLQRGQHDNASHPPQRQRWPHDNASHPPQRQRGSHDNAAHAPQLQRGAHDNAAHAPQLQSGQRGNVSHPPQWQSGAHADAPNGSQLQRWAHDNAAHAPQRQRGVNEQALYAPQRQRDANANASHAPQWQRGAEGQTLYAPQQQRDANANASHAPQWQRGADEQTLYAPQRQVAQWATTSSREERVEPEDTRWQGQRSGITRRECGIHPEELLNFWCVDCSSFVCSECGLVGQHRGHNFRTMRQQASEVQKSLESSIATLNSYALEAAREFEKIDSQSRGVEIIVDNCKQTLRKQIQRLISDLELYQENCEQAYTNAANECFSVLMRSCDVALKAEEMFHTHANDMSLAMASEESDLVEWFDKSHETVRHICETGPQFVDYWPYLESVPSELEIFTGGKALLSTKIPRLETFGLPPVHDPHTTP